MKVTVRQIFESQHELMQLASAIPLPVKVKYWVGRIQTRCQQLAKAFHDDNNKRIEHYGEQGILIAANGQQQFITLDKVNDTTGHDVRWRVKDEHKKEYEAEVEAAMDEPIELTGFNMISIDVFGDKDVDINIAKLEWLFSGLDDGAANDQ